MGVGDSVHGSFLVPSIKMVRVSAAKVVGGVVKVALKWGLLGLGGIVLASGLVLASGCLDVQQGVVELDPSCASGVRWSGLHGPGGSGETDFEAAHQGAPEMHPGGLCIDCHAAAGGPSFVVAGTVFPKLTEPTNCYGSPNVSVHLKDARGERYVLTTNAAGNFFLRQRDARGFRFPFNAEIRYGDGRVSRMFPEQDNGQCNSCHTPTGKNDAPGRICTDPDDPFCNLL
jgi:mono/diheme cytochrome c family protein